MITEVISTLLQVVYSVSFRFLFTWSETKPQKFFLISWLQSPLLFGAHLPADCVSGLTMTFFSVEINEVMIHPPGVTGKWREIGLHTDWQYHPLCGDCFLSVEIIPFQFLFNFSHAPRLARVFIPAVHAAGGLKYRRVHAPERGTKSGASMGRRSISSKICQSPQSHQSLFALQFFCGSDYFRQRNYWNSALQRWWQVR